MGKNKNKSKADKKLKKEKSSKNKDKVKKSKSKASKKEVVNVAPVEVEVDEPVVVVEDTVNTASIEQTSSEVTEPKPTDPTFAELSSKFQEKYSEFIKLGKQLNNEFKTLVKVHNREIRLTKKSRRRRNTDRTKDPSGFNKPTQVPAKVASLFNIDGNTMLARTVVTKMIYDYIKEHKLQEESDKRKIKPDAALTDLFSLTEDDELSFKSFQTHMKKLYPSKSKSTSNVATV